MDKSLKWKLSGKFVQTAYFLRNTHVFIHFYIINHHIFPYPFIEYQLKGRLKAIMRFSDDLFTLFIATSIGSTTF